MLLRNKEELVSFTKTCIEAQAAEVRKVKRSESGMIQDPVTLSEKATVADAKAMMAEFKIGGIPIIDDDGNY